MSILEKIKKMFDNRSIYYEVFEHQPTITVSDSTKIHQNPKEILKGLIFIADEKPIMLVVRGDNKVDTNKLRKILKVGDLRLANQQELEVYTNLKIGNIPPIGELFNLPTYVDEKLKKTENVIFTAGDSKISIKLKSKDFLNVIKCKILDFAKQS